MTAELLARLLSTSALAGTRASLVLLAIAVAARFEVLSAPQPWMTSNVGLGLLLALVVLEELAEQDEDLQALFDTFAYALRGGAGALAVSSVSEVGGPLPEWGAAVLGAAAATGTHHLRARLHQQLQGLGDGVLSPRTWLAWLELGGVVGLLIAVVFAPVIALAFIVLASVGGIAMMLGKRAVEDRVWRRECSSCRFRARVEARRCPSCKQALDVQTQLG
jgi:hypothetical protein